MPKNLGKYIDENDIATKKNVVTYDDATILEHGLMTPEMVTKLNSIESVLLAHLTETSIKNTTVTPTFLADATSLLAERDTNITISFEAKSDVATDIDCYPRTTSALTTYTQVFNIGTEWTRYTAVMTLPANSYQSYTFRSNTNVSGGGGSATASVSIRNIVIIKNESPLLNTTFSTSIIPMDNTIYDLNMTDNLIINLATYSSLRNGTHFILHAGNEVRTLTISGATKITGNDYTGGLAADSIWEVSILRGNVIVKEFTAL